MSKHSKRSVKSPSPNPEQIAAIRRLVESGDSEQAKRRMAALRKSFPDFKPLLGLAWEVEDLCGTPTAATARALEWQRASPNSRAAAEAVCLSARSAGFFMLYARAANRLSVMDGEDEEVLPASIDNPLGALTPDQAEAIDLSRMYLDDANPVAAAAVLQGVDHPSARNNLALALFVGGDVAQAQAVALANWQATPSNLFALESAVRWSCWLKGMDSCLGMKAPLQHTVPLRAEDAIAQVLGLRFLRDETAAAKAWDEAKQADIWDETDLKRRNAFDSLGNPGAKWLGNSAMWFPRQWLNACIDLHSSAHNLNWSDELLTQREEAVAATCDAHADYLVRVVEVGDELDRFLGLSVLKQRARHQDATAYAALTALLKSPSGPDSSRLDLLRWMTEEGLQSKNPPVDVWLNGEVQTLNSRGWHITNEPQASPFPPRGTELNERMLSAIREDKLHLALELSNQLHGMYPDLPSPLANMAAIKEGLMHPPAEIMALYRQAHALDPDYLFARCGLARFLAGEGKVDEADQLLQVLMDRTTFHYSEARSFLLTQQKLALAMGNDKLASELSKNIHTLKALSV